MKSLLKTITLIALFLMFALARAQTTDILVYGKHVIDPATRKKVAEYQYEINNRSGKVLQQLDIGCYKGSTKDVVVQLNFEQQTEQGEVFAEWWKTITPLMPSGWEIEILKVEGSYEYCLELKTTSEQNTYGIPIGKSTKNTGQNFVLRLMRLDPNYVKAHIKYYYNLPTIQPSPFDTVPPKLSYHLETHQHGKHHHIKHRHGWTQVEIEDVRITDNYDPHPAVLLTSVTSKDKDFKPEDVDAIYNEETKSFWVKRVPNRQYTVIYTGMDASGNKVEVSRNIWAH